LEARNYLALINKEGHALAGGAPTEKKLRTCFLLLFNSLAG
jgi:hypothetical protein